jgi:aquaporin Z
MLTDVIFYVVYTKDLRWFSGVTIDRIITFNILFLAFISDVSLNITRALTLILLPETFDNL